MTSEIARNAIKEIIRNGWDVIQLFYPGSRESMFFIVYKFEHAYFNSTQSIEYNVLEGIDITEFMTRNASFAQNNVSFTNNLYNVVKRSLVVRIQFTNNVIWYKWSLVTDNTLEDGRNTTPNFRG